NHGPLGALYPQDYVSEGDSPAFLYSIANGLRNHEHPTYGGWGGRFTKFNQFEKVYTDAKDDGDIKKSLRHWVEDANRDFQARMDWCVQSFKDANHPPIVQINQKEDIEVKGGNTVSIDAGKTNDPDGDELEFKWWQYKDAGSYNGMADIKNANSDKISLTAPKVSNPETIHIILEVSDNGSPMLKGYQRIIINVIP
ncbi:MAG: DUF1593 domain-containing protein, partial [Bacteroidetes bacterium]